MKKWKKKLKNKIKKMETKWKTIHIKEKSWKYNKIPMAALGHHSVYFNMSREKIRSHARHAARSTALVQTWIDQSETLLLFFAETNQRQSCSRVPQSSWSLSSTCAEELWVEIEKRACEVTLLKWSWPKRNAIAIFTCGCFLPRWDSMW